MFYSGGEGGQDSEEGSPVEGDRLVLGPAAASGRNGSSRRGSGNGNGNEGGNQAVSRGME